MRRAMQSILLRELWVFIFLLSASIAASSGELVSRSFLGSSRRLDASAARGESGECRAVAMKLMAPPALQAYEECFMVKLRSNSSHDWSIPGAEVKAQMDCWCQHNLTATMTEYSCCEHSDIYPMCSLNCQPDCQSALATECIQSCSAMCFEASEYIIDQDLCVNCNWVKCWPVLPCIVDHAEERVESGDLARTCHETELARAPELKEYWQCWMDSPKHSSHWNILGAIIHCICREDMQRVAKETHCCESVSYGGGACDVECVSETECATQDAQTCIHGCQLKCPALDLTPSEQCIKDCLRSDSPCRKYISCRPPATGNYICADGRWPQSSSGCCENNKTNTVGCPRLCENQRMWRLDRTKGIPWWARWHEGEGMVAQCTCTGCPDSLDAVVETVANTVENDLWQNGQMLLLEIARREGLELGPNRRMQELMRARNQEIAAVTAGKQMAEETSSEEVEIDDRIAEINRRYSSQITDAARVHGDVQTKQPQMTVKDETPVTITIVVCTCVLLFFGSATLAYVVYKKKQANCITSFEANQQVVIGQPVAGEEPGIVTTGAPVTVAAPMKNTSGKQQSFT